MRIHHAFLTTSIVTSLIIFQVSAQEEDTSESGSLVSYGIETDFSTLYLWHGIPVSDGPVFQPWLWVSAFDLTISLWANAPMQLPDSMEDPAFYGDRIDDFELLIHYQTEFHGLKIAPTLQFYFLPSDEISGELTMKFAYPVWRFDIFTSHTFDFIQYPGAYFGDLGLELEHEFSDAVTMNVSTAIGWASSTFNHVNLEIDKAQFNVLSADIALTWYPLDFLYIYPHAAFVWYPSNDVRDVIDAPVNVTGGAALGLEF